MSQATRKPIRILTKNNMFLDEKIILEIDCWLEDLQTVEDAGFNIVNICLDAIRESKANTEEGIIVLFKRIDNSYQLAVRTLDEQKKPHFLKLLGFRELVRTCDGVTVKLDFRKIRNALKW